MSRERSALRDRLEFAGYRMARTLAGSLDPVSLAKIGSALGDVFHLVARRRRKIIRFNLALAYPDRTDPERRRLARAVSRHFGTVALDALRFQGMTPETFLAEVEMVDADHADRAAALGRGVIYFTGHIGLWEVAALVIGLRRPETFKVINRPLDNPLLDGELNRLRGQFGNVPMGKHNIAREILRQLKDGGGVGILFDQRVPEDQGVPVLFFGHEVPTHPILARVVRRTGAPVVPTFAIWQSPGRYTVSFREPIVPDELPAGELEDRPLTARCTAILESAIRDHPEQWLWHHDRWRHLRLAQ